jgi:NAD(P)-dependent dehydrogenase (short-subunit alcohol dehydrogenase family)
MSYFKDKVVVVTGGANGIGKGICLAFSGAGARVVCADLDDEAGAQLEREAGGTPGEIRYQRADVATLEGCRDAVAAAGTAGIDVLCNNVGIQPLDCYIPVHDLPVETWDRIIDVNLKSYFMMTKLSIPEILKRGGGAIINTASVQGLQSMKGVGPYAASKGGILSLTRQLAIEYAAQNIRVLAVNPGTIDTQMVAEAIAAMDGDPADIKKEFGRCHPLKRIGAPAEVANVVLFLASDKASFMTGENVSVDGGMMAVGAWSGE